MTEGTHLIRVPLGQVNGRNSEEQVLFEVEAVTSGIVRAARPGEIAGTAARTLADSFDQVRAAAESLLDKLTALSSPPDTVEVELGVKINAEAGAVIAKTAAEGNFTVRLVWQKPGGTG